MLTRYALSTHSHGHCSSKFSRSAVANQTTSFKDHLIVTPQSQHSEKLTDDETRLLIFFRALTPSQQSQLVESAGTQAWERCMPEKGVFRFMPAAARIDPGEITGSVWSPNVEGTIIEIIRDGIENTGEPRDVLLGTDAFDEVEAIPRFSAAAQATADRRGTYFKFDEAFAREYLRAWRMEIASFCEWRTSRMAKSIAEAEQQELCIPDSADDWIAFALTLDGDRIAAEIGLDPPGYMDTDLRLGLSEFNKPSDQRLFVDDDWPLSPVLSMRMALYQRLRYLQAHDYPLESSEELEEIAEVLSWLREQSAHTRIDASQSTSTRSSNPSSRRLD